MSINFIIFNTHYKQHFTRSAIELPELASSNHILLLVGQIQTQTSNIIINILLVLSKDQFLRVVGVLGHFKQVLRNSEPFIHGTGSQWV